MRVDDVAPTAWAPTLAAPHGQCPTVVLCAPHLLCPAVAVSGHVGGRCRGHRHQTTYTACSSTGLHPSSASDAEYTRFESAPAVLSSGDHGQLAVSDHLPWKRPVLWLWRSPWAWPPVGITLAAISGQRLGGVGALTVLAIVAGIAVVGLTGLMSPFAKRTAALQRIFRK